jgi:hypothetical protein
MRRIQGVRLAAAALLAAFLTLPAMAVEPAVPPQVQAAIIAKLWQFDHNFVPHGPLTLAVLYQSKVRSSFVAAHDLCHEFEAAHLPVRCVFIDVESDATPLPLQGIDAAYIAPLRAINVEALFGLMRVKRIRTVTAVDEYVPAGAAVGLSLRGDHAEIVVNLPASRAEGADFSAQLLKLARIVP